jgi:DNA-binding transcriptional MerR regulator
MTPRAPLPETGRGDDGHDLKLAERLLEHLTAVLDLDTGLQDVLEHQRSDHLLRNLTGVLNLDAGLTRILPTGAQRVAASGPVGGDRDERGEDEDDSVAVFLKQLRRLPPVTRLMIRRSKSGADLAVDMRRVTRLLDRLAEHREAVHRLVSRRDPADASAAVDALLRDQNEAEELARTLRVHAEASGHLWATQELGAGRPDGPVAWLVGAKVQVYRAALDLGPLRSDRAERLEREIVGHLEGALYHARALSVDMAVFAGQIPLDERTCANFRTIARAICRALAGALLGSIERAVTVRPAEVDNNVLETATAAARLVSAFSGDIEHDVLPDLPNGLGRLASKGTFGFEDSLVRDVNEALVVASILDRLAAGARYVGGFKEQDFVHACQIAKELLTRLEDTVARLEVKSEGGGAQTAAEHPGSGTPSDEAERYTIEELAAAAGMTARNVRAYRTRGLLPEPIRVGRVTRYGRRHLTRLLEVQELRGAGVPLRSITAAVDRGESLGHDSPLWQGLGETAASGTRVVLPDASSVSSSGEVERRPTAITPETAAAAVLRAEALVLGLAADLGNAARAVGVNHNLRETGSILEAAHRASEALHGISTVLNDHHGADLRDADLSQVVSLDGVRWTDATVWPDGARADIERRSVDLGEGVWEIREGLGVTRAT